MLQLARRRRRGRAAASRPRSPRRVLCQRKPATTQSHSRSCLTLSITRLFGSYAPVAGLAITPSSPAPSKRRNQSAAVVAIGRRRREVQRRRAPCQQRLELLAPLAETAVARRSRSPSHEQVEEHDRRRDLLGQQRHARRRRVDAHAGAPRSRAPPSFAITISPSSTQRSGSCALSGSISSGK